ncbi:MAG: hypothetical protein KAV82_03280 [Phycisphaerae bacterium]|nr:hypothetical protein [Phycisphaerae bacterium]
MSTLNHILTALFDVIYTPFNVLPHWFSLTLISAVIGVAALVVVKYTSNQAAIARIKDSIKANMLSIKLFKDNLRVMFVAQKRVIWAALCLQGRMLPPLLVMFIPFVLIAAQMGMRYQWRPLEIGEQVVLTAMLADDAERSDFDLEIPQQSGFVADHRLRAFSDSFVSWRLRAEAEGVHTITISNGQEAFTKRLAVGEAIDRVCPVRPGSGFWGRLIYPGEEPFESSSLVRSVRLESYPEHDSWYAGADWWLLWFVVVSIVFAFIFKPVLKVRF